MAGLIFFSAGFLAVGFFAGVVFFFFPDPVAWPLTLAFFTFLVDVETEVFDGFLADVFLPFLPARFF
ncbi:MAG: hypothetical protein AB7T38_18235 [Nitrospirales bacterium]